ncbi:MULTISPECIES: FliI/YscN family ATPase [unclassified Caballeronia]|uniref:FliI/YscN family ATPase n=1 Tax=unclassified Caballeronia TaxID=2646786 RepID=UPI0028554074|nr:MULTISPECIES: FliI/YscN family ATPase [unclassified Caballeronia]MDR5774154.1 FliI/YscN family ATPase [Caballeronia sp. LZ002]MDR5849589.1 FliI/YscN family ATPase [Caballeronia sp. LZ003]
MTSPSNPSSHRFVEAVRAADVLTRKGAITRVMPTFIEADGPGVPVGALCRIEGTLPILAEVVRTEIGRITLAPFAPLNSIRIGDEVCSVRTESEVRVGDGLLGRVIDPLGQPLDSAGAVGLLEATWPLAGIAASPLERTSPSVPLQTGIRAIDTLLTLGIGQRAGIFAGSGVGKSTLLGSLARNIEADVCVVCLVGERGREAEEFWRRTLSDEARARSTMVVATSDQPAVLRARCVLHALAIAEYFRSKGLHVLLLLDSVTRYALALREIGLSAGEPPTMRAYTPGVFAALPKVVERCGGLLSGGAITALMTVLTETDEIDDPMAETMRALLDGHIVLTRSLAEQGHYPAIDVPRSISRAFQHVTTAAERHTASEAIAQLSTYESSRTLIESGLYVAGSQPLLDRALATRSQMIEFLRQDSDKQISRADANAALAALHGHAT